MHRIAWPLLAAALVATSGCREEGVVTVRSIEFVGVTAVDHAQIKAVLATRESAKLPWGRKFPFDRSRFDADLKRIEAFYADRGYPDARVTRVDVRPNRTMDAVPTDVAFAPNGDIYVSDGYGSARVVKFSREGKYLLQWGRRGAGPGEFGLPHNLVADAQGRVYVADRDNERIEAFDASGNFLAEWKNTGGVSALALTKDGRIWTGAILRDLNGNVIGRLPEASGAHGATVDAAGNVYLAQLTGVVQKFTNLRAE